MPTVSPSLLERPAGMSFSIWVAHSSFTDLNAIIVGLLFLLSPKRTHLFPPWLTPIECLHKLVSSRPLCRWLNFWAIFFFNSGQCQKLLCYNSTRFPEALHFKASCYPVLWHKFLWHCKLLCCGHTSWHLVCLCLSATSWEKHKLLLFNCQLEKKEINLS